MVEENNAIAIIPSDCFRWRARVQFVDSFRTQAAALNFAFEHGYNLIVERNEGSNPLFDVLQDPDGACTADLKLELLRNKEVLVEPEPTSWTLLMFWTLWHLARRFGNTMARMYVGKVAPLLHQATSQQRWAEILRVVRLAWYRHAHWNIRNFNRRFGAATNLYRAEIAGYCRAAASRCWWSGQAVGFRRWLHRNSQGSVRDLAKRLAAIMASLYNREVAPRLRHAASRVRQANFKAAFRSAWSISLLAACDLAQRFVAASSNLYIHEIAPRLHHAVSSIRQANIQATFRRAWSITILTAIRLIDQFLAAATGFYVGKVAPRLRRAAASYQQAEIEEALRRSIGAVAPPQHSNSSQLG